jgi:hypothetical protein
MKGNSFMGTKSAFVATLACLASLGLGTLAQADTVLTIASSEATIGPGGTFSVEVNVAGVSDLYGYQFDVLFNPNVLEALTSSEGSFLSQGGSTFFIPGTNDNVGGVVAATANTLLSPVPGVSGSGNLAVLTFEALKSGASSIAISGAELIDSGFNSINTSTTGGSITVGPSGMIAPEIDPASAASALTLLLGSLVVLRTSCRVRR